jgi:hypothetical protein
MEWCLGVASVIDSVDLCDCFTDYRYRWEWVILVGMRTEAIGAGAGGEPTVTEGGSWRTRRFWVPLIWAAVPRCDASGGSRSDHDVSLSSPDGLVRRIGEQEKNRKVKR